ncbi:hypothetical protein BTZ20_2852 [Rhodococcus sp. MTM3W5.2]|nr:hypothetical protein BTZ20_2852 [Rhodococcus sp. MTM3W5.2]
MCWQHDCAGAGQQRVLRVWRSQRAGASATTGGSSGFSTPCASVSSLNGVMLQLRPSHTVSNCAAIVGVWARFTITTSCRPDFVTAMNHRKFTDVE